MKPFNLEEAKAGKPVCTRDGRPARVVCFDRVGYKEPIIALHQHKGGREQVYYHYIDGTYYAEAPSEYDLFMASVTKTVWANLYRNSAGKVYVGTCICDTEVEAKELSNKGTCYVGTYPITYEE